MLTPPMPPHLPAQFFCANRVGAAVPRRLRRTLALLAAGLAFVLLVGGPPTAYARTAAPDDVKRGCGVLKDVGSEYDGHRIDGSLYFLPFGTPSTFCNVSIAIKGQFEITNPARTSCLAVNNTTALVDQDTASACAKNHGAGYPWDRWTARGITYHGNRLWLIASVYDRGYCLWNYSRYPPFGLSAWVLCNRDDHYQWFSWPGSRL
jgi:hypothetical protein